MEYLQGLDLDQLVRRHGPLDVARVAHLLGQAASALAEAHAKGLVHRDVKPSNLMVGACGGVADTIKMLDFGLVKSLDGVTDDAARTQMVTQAMTVVGTPHYLAPEAIRRESSLGPLADVYALGAVGYFLLSGREVFSGPTAIEVMALHLNGEVPPASELAGRPVDAGLEAVLRRCLSKAPDGRFWHGRALATALEALALDGWTQAAARAWRDEHQPEASVGAGDIPRTQLAIDMSARRESRAPGAA